MAHQSTSPSICFLLLTLLLHLLSVHATTTSSFLSSFVPFEPRAESCTFTLGTRVFVAGGKRLTKFTGEWPWWNTLSDVWSGDTRNESAEWEQVIAVAPWSNQTKSFQRPDPHLGLHAMRCMTIKVDATLPARGTYEVAVLIGTSQVEWPFDSQGIAELMWITDDGINWFELTTDVGWLQPSDSFGYLGREGFGLIALQRELLLWPISSPSSVQFIFTGGIDTLNYGRVWNDVEVIDLVCQFNSFGRLIGGTIHVTQLPDAAWQPRAHHMFVSSIDGLLVVAGGFTVPIANTFLNWRQPTAEVWLSIDARHWYAASESFAPWSNRRAPGVIQYGRDFYAVGGYDEPLTLTASPNTTWSIWRIRIAQFNRSTLSATQQISNATTYASLLTALITNSTIVSDLLSFVTPPNYNTSIHTVKAPFTGLLSASHVLPIIQLPTLVLAQIDTLNNLSEPLLLPSAAFVGGAWTSTDSTVVPEPSIPTPEAQVLTSSFALPLEFIYLTTQYDRCLSLFDQLCVFDTSLGLNDHAQQRPIPASLECYQRSMTNTNTTITLIDKQVCIDSATPLPLAIPCELPVCTNLNVSLTWSLRDAHWSTCSRVTPLNGAASTTCVQLNDSAVPIEDPLTLPSPLSRQSLLSGECILVGTARVDGNLTLFVLPLAWCSHLTVRECTLPLCPLSYTWRVDLTSVCHSSTNTSVTCIIPGLPSSYNEQLTSNVSRPSHSVGAQDRHAICEIRSGSVLLSLVRLAAWSSQMNCTTQQVALPSLTPLPCQLPTCPIIFRTRALTALCTFYRYGAEFQNSNVIVDSNSTLLVLSLTKSNLLAAIGMNQSSLNSSQLVWISLTSLHEHSMPTLISLASAWDPPATTCDFHLLQLASVFNLSSIDNSNSTVNNTKSSEPSRTNSSHFAWPSVRGSLSLVWSCDGYVTSSDASNPQLQLVWPLVDARLCATPSIDSFNAIPIVGNDLFTPNVSMNLDTCLIPAACLVVHPPPPPGVNETVSSVTTVQLSIHLHVIYSLLLLSYFFM